MIGEVAVQSVPWLTGNSIAESLSAGREIVVAPVTITPTKPLTPTHVKGLLWADVLLKATAQVNPVRLVWNPRLSNLTAQTAAFWAHLDRTEPYTDWSTVAETGIGERYVRMHAAGPEPALDRDAVRAHLERVEDEGWIHPASRRLLDLWRDEFALLVVGDPGLTADAPLRSTNAEVFGLLTDRGMLIDHRRYGGPVHLDGARWGMPIRQLVGVDGHVNYLLPILRELLPQITPERVFLLLFDDGLTGDYLLLDRVLTAFGATVTRLPLSRVPIAGTVQSSRYGGWQGSTLADLSRAYGSDVAAYRLGMRLYFVGMLDRRSTQSFRTDLLGRSVARAARLLQDAPGAGADNATEQRHRTLLRALAAPNGYVDPYRLTVSMLGRRATPVHHLLRRIYG